ncbi:MAG: hypothetical protein WCK03_02825, partial [Candidatus Taylorbacteria bacterium]
KPSVEYPRSRESSPKESMDCRGFDNIGGGDGTMFKPFFRYLPGGSCSVGPGEKTFPQRHLRRPK